MMKKTAILGASPNTQRYAYKATERLKEHGHSVWPLGFRSGKIGDLDIITEWPDQIDGLDTITMYIGKARQPEFYEQIIKWAPKRVVFNPGTENTALYNLLDKAGIAHEEACTLVLLATNAY